MPATRRSDKATRRSVVIADSIVTNLQATAESAADTIVEAPPLATADERHVFLSHVWSSGQVSTPTLPPSNPP